MPGWFERRDHPWVNWDEFVREANGFSIFCGDLEDPTTAVTSWADNRRLASSTLTGSEDSDGGLALVFRNESVLTVRWMLWRGPGSPLAKTILGASNWLRGTSDVVTEGRREAANRLGRTRVLIGCVFDPLVTDPEDARFTSLVELSSLVDGMLFNGWTLARADTGELVTTRQTT